MNDRHAILELARFLTELSVIDYFFVIHKPSVVALASLLNAMEDIPGAAPAIPAFTIAVEQNTPLDPSQPEVLECRNRLRLLYAQGGYSHPTPERTDPRDESISPVCVSYGCQPNAAQGQYDPFDSRSDKF
jgi:hypothetical protein